MDLKQTNPCEYETYVKLMSWAETDCWCCTATRSGMMALILGFGLGLLVSGHVGLAVLWTFVAGALGIAGLVWARKNWTDEDEGEGK